jgi:hypothetical protein
MRLLLVGLLLLSAACGTTGDGDRNAVQGDTLTERQRDSILAGSSIPGARGVGTAHNAADSASARAAIADTIGP